MKLLLFLIVILILSIYYIYNIYIPNIDEVENFLETTKYIPIDYSKINGIESINWINLDRSPDRAIKNEKLLSHVLIPNNRISAVDGKKEDLSKYKRFGISNNEIGCTLSHIKAINSLKDSSGEYFMICEDDISFDNLKYFNESLEDIIKDSPEFDILLIFNNNPHEFDLELYQKWNRNIAGAVAYIISKKGINKFINQVAKYSNGNFQLYKPIERSDLFIYKYLNTIVYKYNFISTQFDYSTIHSSHLHSHKKNYYFQINNIMNK